MGEREVPTQWVGEKMMEGLAKLDEVAYVRFASVYRQFKDINEFMDELKGLLDTRKEQSG
jgi:transcriptional repressor NrdR